MKHDHQTSATLVALFFTLAALLTLATASANDHKPCDEVAAIENKSAKSAF